MTDAPAWARLGEAVKTRRIELRMSRGDVQAAGGPSPATVQRIENAEAEGLKDETKADLEIALRLPEGWINAILTGSKLPDLVAPAVAVASDSAGEKILVGIVEGIAELSDEELRAVLTLVNALRRGDGRT